MRRTDGVIEKLLKKQLFQSKLPPQKEPCTCYHFWNEIWVSEGQGTAQLNLKPRAGISSAGGLRISVTDKLLINGKR